MLGFFEEIISNNQITVNDSYLKSIYELYIDIINFCGHELRGNIR